MTLMHRLRRAALKIGLDVRRAEATGPARLVQLLGRLGVDCVFDVGANEGQFGQALRQCGFQGRICSFEPRPDSVSALARHAATDPLWSAHEFALGDRDDHVILNIAGNVGAASSSVLPMLPRHEAAAPESRYVDAIRVPVRRLDSVWDGLASADESVFLKLDVQGFEGPVLAGAGDRLDDVVGIQLEISLVPLYGGAMTPRDVFDRMGDVGMSLVQIEPGFSDPATGDLLQVDAVFVREDRS